jgi:hypothetical protein
MRDSVFLTQRGQPDPLRKMLLGTAEKEVLHLRQSHRRWSVVPRNVVRAEVALVEEYLRDRDASSSSAPSTELLAQLGQPATVHNFL